MTSASPFLRRSCLLEDLVALGVEHGDLVMVHASCRRVGPVIGGPDGIIAALREAIGATGTIAAYLDWDAPWEDLVDEKGSLAAKWREEIIGFDPAATRAARYVGVLPEFLRTTPGAVRSCNPGASVAALGSKAEWLTADHPLDYGYGAGSPFAKLVSARGKVLMLGAPLDTMTLLHHAEHLARLPSKRVIRIEAPFATAEGTAWRTIEEFDTSDPVVDTLPENFIEQIVLAYLATGRGRSGTVGQAQSVLVSAADILPFAIDWVERHTSRD